MRAILRWRTRILIFLSTLALFIMLQGYMVPRPENITNRGNLATTYEDDFSTGTSADIDTHFQDEIIETVQQEPDPLHESYLLGSTSFISRLPKIQRQITSETADQKLERETRREAIKDGFKHAWGGYKQYAMGHDELMPVTNKPVDPFGGWGATVADSLSTMLVMELFEEFEDATHAMFLPNFSITNDKDISTFETIIRYLGGFLSAYELSGDERMLQKAEEVGKVVIDAFDTQSGLPYHRWDMGRNTFKNAWVSFAEVASVQMEFTTLTRHTGNPIYAEKAQKIIDFVSNAGVAEGLHIRGLYPYTMDVVTGKFTSTTSSFGAMGDSAFEYFLKQYLLTDGQDEQYAQLYKESIAAMKKHMLRQTSKANLLFLHPFDTRVKLIASTMDHLSCFVPGMLAIGSKIFDEPEDLLVAKGLLETCVHMYRTSKTGLSPEKWTFHEGKAWNPKTYEPDNYWSTEKNKVANQKELDEAVSGLGNSIGKQVSALFDHWSSSFNAKEQTDNRLKGIFVSDGSYLLRPETVESLFVLYRITGDRKYQDYGWDIWLAIEEYCKTPSAYSAVRNVNFDATVANLSDYSSIHMDKMESFFFAETLKYLYLLFSPDNVISLDKFVFNTEAHPLLRRKSHLDTQVLNLDFGHAK
ncbi:glycosyl hydrolase family 47-domain-containing protein [Umbelopsis sp. AD052]|nr:glycosyl hydrolase family 47-domain-containing protein [Umbelopsis sp. AD052]